MDINAIVPVGSDEGEEEDEESASSPSVLDHQLSNFRQQWREELTSARSRGRRRRKSSSRGEELDTPHEKAYSLFMQGVEAERSGQMFEAIHFYRQAVQIVPDIESKIEEFSECEDFSSDESEGSGQEDEEDVVEELSSQLSVTKIHDITSTCKKEFPNKSTHISALPVELLLLVFRWVVSSHLDLRSLEQLSLVCRGFYSCSRDLEIWRRVCQKIWGNAVYLTKDYFSWRQMYMERPHLRFDGAYICRITYFRPGEQSFIDQSYKPWHLVEYYRYIKVFPDGIIIMLTCPEEPKEVVGKLRWKSINGEGILRGHYRMAGNVLSAILQRERQNDQRFKNNRNRNNSGGNTIKEQSFHVEFIVNGYGHSSNTKLEWQLYTCHTQYMSSPVVSISDFDLSSLKPLFFSRVKSYTRTAVKPL